MERLLYFLPDKSLPVWIRYGGALFIMALCATVQFGVEAQTQLALLFFLLPGIFLTGFLFDRGTSLFTVLLAAGYAYYTLSQSVTFPAWLLPCVLFAATGGVVGIVAEALRTEMEKVVRSEQRKSVLLMELAHRTKNNLAMLSALMKLQSKQPDTDGSQTLQDMADRIQVMAQVYDHLTIRVDQKVVDASQYLKEICRHLAGSISGQNPVAIRVNADELYIHSEQAVPIAMIMNELITNSLKYAFPEGQAGSIQIDLRVTEEVVLSVTDNGKGGARVGSEGIGSRVVSLLAQQLGGKIEVDDLGPGSRVVLRMPKPTI